MTATKLRHDLPAGTVARLLVAVTRRDLTTRRPVVIECGWEVEVLGPDGGYAGVPAYRVRDHLGRCWHGFLAAWLEPLGVPGPPAADSLFD